MGAGGGRGRRTGPRGCRGTATSRRRYVTTETGSATTHRWVLMVEVRDCSGASSQDSFEISYLCEEMPTGR
jgi:hypothetical protein